MEHPKVEIYKHFVSTQGEAEDEWGWRLKSANGEIVAQGEGHRDPRDAERACRGVLNTVLKLVGAFLEVGSWADLIVVVNDVPLLPPRERQEGDPGWH